MQRLIMATCGAIVVAGLTAAASQSNPAGTRSSTTPPSGEAVTMTGCVKPASAGVGASSSATHAGQYILDDAEMKKTGTPDSSAGSTQSRSGAGAGASDEDKYVLRPETSTVNLSQYVNQKVEITGRVQAMTTSREPSTGVASPGSTPGSSTPGSSTTPGSSAPGSSTSGSTPGSSSGSSARSSSQSELASLPTLSVSSIKTVSTTCS